MRIGQFAKRWFLPPGITAAVQALRTNLVSGATERHLLRANGSLRGRHAGQRGFILCTGPSVKNQDLKILQGQNCISVANFFVHPDYGTINPRYHCVAPLHPPFTDTDGLRWFREMEQPLKGKDLFLALSDRQLVTSAGLFAGTQVHYLALNRTWSDPSRETAALDERLPQVQSVSIMALLVALELGFNEIYLVGTDHTSIDFQKGKYSYNHFYSGQRTNSLGELAAPPDLESEFASYAELWRQYKIVRIIANRRGCRIYNATLGGMLDLFPRVELDSLLL